MNSTTFLRLTLVSAIASANFAHAADSPMLPAKIPPATGSQAAAKVERKSESMQQLKADPLADPVPTKAVAAPSKPEFTIAKPEAAPARAEIPHEKPASTASVATSANVATFRQLDELRSQNAILAEAAKSAELRTKVGGNAQGSGGLFIDGQRPSMASTSSNTMPTVLMVSGSDYKLVAQVSLPNGSYVNARVGTKIAGVGTVKSISVNEVVVANRNELITLPFATESSFLGGAR